MVNRKRKRKKEINGCYRSQRKEVELLARLIRAEAEADGNLAMLMVANVGLTGCLRTVWIFATSAPSSRWSSSVPEVSNRRSVPIFTRLPGKRNPPGQKSPPGRKIPPATFALWFYNAGMRTVRPNGSANGTADAINRIAFMRRSKVKGVMPDIEAGIF